MRYLQYSVIILLLSIILFSQQGITPGDSSDFHSNSIEISDSLHLQLNSLKSKIQQLQKEQTSKEIESAKEHIEYANSLISWSGYILTALAIFLTLAGVYGVFELSKIRNTRQEMTDELIKIKDEMKNITDEKEEIIRGISKQLTQMNDELENIKNDKIEILQEAKNFARVNYFLNQGKLLYGFGRHIEAREHLRKVLEIEPQNITAHYYLGNSYRLENKGDKAITEYEKIKEIDPKNARAFYGIAMVYGINNPEEAIKNYNIALELNPENVKAYNRLGTLYRSDNLEKALECYLKAANINNDANTSFNIGLIYYAKGDSRKAERYFANSKSYSYEEMEITDSPKWEYHYLAVIAGLEGNLTKSKELYEKALSINNSLGVRLGMKSDLVFLVSHIKDEKTKQEIAEMISFLGDDVNGNIINT